MEALVTGVKKHGAGNWRIILDSNPDVFEHRTNVNLKDKWRQMTSKNLVGKVRYRTPSKRRPVKDLYAVLGVARFASQADVQRGFRDRVAGLELDPQAKPDGDEDEQRREIEEAMRVLSNPVSKAEYDAQLELAEGPLPAQASPASVASQTPDKASSQESKIGQSLHQYCYQPRNDSIATPQLDRTTLSSPGPQPEVAEAQAEVKAEVQTGDDAPEPLSEQVKQDLGIFMTQIEGSSNQELRDYLITKGVNEEDMPPRRQERLRAIRNLKVLELMEAEASGARSASPSPQPLPADPVPCFRKKFSRRSPRPSPAGPSGNPSPARAYVVRRVLTLEHTSKLKRHRSDGETPKPPRTPRFSDTFVAAWNAYTNERPAKRKRSTQRRCADFFEFLAERPELVSPRHFAPQN